MRILLSRTDSIGDVILTLPMAGVLKALFPEVHVSFLGKAYTRAIIERCAFVDEFYEWNEENPPVISADIVIHVLPRSAISRWAKQQKIPQRVGTSHRVFHWFSCNRLVNLGRKNSDLHEAQLNLQLLRPLTPKVDYSLDQLSAYYRWNPSQHLRDYFSQYLATDKFNLLLHPKSQGSAKEWPLRYYLALVEQLSPAKFQILITGTAQEGEKIKAECPEFFTLPHVKDTTGAFSLSEFIDFISHADGLVACSTGPLHIAATSGIYALGLYPDQRPMHAGRWGPIGKKAEYIEATFAKEASDLSDISVEEAIRRIINWKLK
ncbi:glycosyltransferase family 9 protein [Tunicatimonas pelagia]|uniref:glycosyltransferase family 9 protein n=1 Tax=Tunicatimonas pelagia TaxID=931531 RepID=UPI0026655C8E|nr:glycosyltransferase family 9 protein [Tunicatimonas pelagia]WKN41947.1 glycosyltransferase family 9 protein [Tunicatimonas pelagia]